MLKGKSFVIGREESQNRLLLYDENTHRSVPLTYGIKVPASISRLNIHNTDAPQAHVRLSVTADGNIVLSNMKATNMTYVNGVAIASKRLTGQETVELGADRYRLDIKNVLSAAQMFVGNNATTGNTNKEPKNKKDIPEMSYDISHLREVWMRFNEGKMAVATRQRKVNMIRAGSALFTMCSMPCIIIFENRAIGLILTGIGIIGNLVSFLGLKQENAAKTVDELTEQFQDNYVCPHCHKFLGMMSYKLMKNMTGMKCPHCKCGFSEK